MKLHFFHPLPAAEMSVVIKETAFDPWQTLQEFQNESGLRPGSFGATATFVGTMRVLNEGDGVDTMTLEHYPGMTAKHLASIIDTARQRWDVLECLIVHRVGEITPNDPIVLTAVWSAHRAAAFEACRFLMEELKSTAPFWKKEALKEGGQRWVDRNTPG